MMKSLNWLDLKIKWSNIFKDIDGSFDIERAINEKLHL